MLDDGGEVDLDLGNYERFLDVMLCKDNNITTGKIYESVIQKERKGDFLGRTVQGQFLNFLLIDLCKGGEAVPITRPLFLCNPCITHMSTLLSNLYGLYILNMYLYI